MTLKQAVLAVRMEMALMRAIRQNRPLCDDGSRHELVPQSELTEVGWLTTGYACSKCDLEI